MKPQLVDYSQINFGDKIVKKIYTKTERLSIFFNGILILIIITGFIFLYYRYITKDEMNKEVQNKLNELNNLIYN